MLIDADVHISPIREIGSISAEELIRRMDKAGVDQALTWLQPPYLRQIDDANRYVYDSMLRYPDRILGFGWADPNLGVQKAKDMAKRCIEEYGFYGVKLNGAQNSFFIDDPELSLPVIETIASLGTRLAFHVGSDAFEQTHPFRVGKIAARFPEIPILMVHMGGASVPDLSASAMEIAAQYPNITLIGSNVSYKAVLQAVETLGAHRVCFGSDTPFLLMHVELAAYRALLAEAVTEEAAALIFGGNIQKLFGLA